MEIYRTFRPCSVLDRWSFIEGNWLFKRGGHTWRFDCICLEIYILATLKLVLTFGSLLRSHLGPGHMTSARAVAKETNI